MTATLKTALEQVASRNNTEFAPLLATQLRAIIRHKSSLDFSDGDIDDIHVIATAIERDTASRSFCNMAELVIRQTRNKIHAIGFTPKTNSY